MKLEVGNIKVAVEQLKNGANFITLNVPFGSFAIHVVVRSNPTASSGQVFTIEVNVNKTGER